MQVVDRQGQVGGQLLVDRARPHLDALGLDVELAEQTEELDEGLAGGRHGVARADARLGLHVDDEAVEVGARLDARGLDLVAHLQHGRVQRVDGDPPYLGVGVVVEGARHVAAAPLDDELHLDGAVLGQGGDVQLGVVDLDAGRHRDVGGGDLAGARLAQVHGDRLVLLAREHEALEVEDDLGDVLDDARQRGELVLVALDLDRGDRGAGDRAEQRAAQ